MRPLAGSASLDRDLRRLYRSRVVSAAHMAGQDLTLAIATGVGLAAAVGFRLTVHLVRRLFRRERPADSSGVR